MSSSVPPVAGRGSALPVFVFPTSLQFVADRSSSHKQVLTLYNPYDFPVAYRVLCTAPRKYTVVEPEGTLKARCCLDIVVRHLASTVRSNVGKSDRFRFYLHKHGESDVCGSRDVSATLYANAADAEAEQPATATDAAQSHFSGAVAEASRAAARQYAFPAGAARQDAAPGGAGPSLLLVAVAVACLTALALPTDGERTALSASLPVYAHLSVAQKLVAAYVLGLLTMLLLRHQ